MALAIAFALVIGTIGTATIAYAGDDDDDGGVLQTLLCPAGKALTGIVSGGGDDDDDGGGILDLICDADIAALQDKDMQLMDKDMALMDKDMALMDEDTRLQGEIDNIALTPGPKGDKGDTGSQGPKGDKGDKGDPGTGGNELQGLVITYREGPPRTITGSGGTGSAFATCNADEKILGGGYNSGCGSLHPSSEEFAPQGTFPPAVLNSDAWLIFFKNNCPVDVDVTVTAICGKLSP